MKVQYELKGLKEEINGVIAVFVNSGYRVYWDTIKVGNKNHKVLVVDDGKGEEK